MALRKIPSVALCTALSLLQAPVWAAPVAFESRKLSRANPSSPPTAPPAAASATTTQGSSAAAKPSTPPAPAPRATTAPPPAAAPPPKAAAAGAASSAGKPDANPPDGQVKKARDLWYRGVEAFRAGNYEEARVAFAECYQIMPKSDVLRNLSISEIQSGHYVSAARHLTQLLAAPGELPSNVREEANNRLAQAEAQIGQLQIAVDVAGAEVSIDGNVIGRSPLPGKWYIEPGQHEILVSKAGYPVESRQVFALAGVVIPVDVSLETLRREQAADAKAAELMGTREGEPPAVANDR
ncbi:MAG TPA: PEGA domain-containing protein, partial [Polyangiaceae bacterium]|nr:PEGA domain-containing protein [Polyangiaceae bacterium]